MLHRHADFEVGPDPAFRTHLVPLAEVTTRTAVDRSVIWCERFRVLISPARLGRRPAA